MGAGSNRETSSNVMYSSPISVRVLKNHGYPTLTLTIIPLQLSVSEDRLDVLSPNPGITQPSSRNASQLN